MLFSGGYGSGKTRAGAEKALRLALANPGVRGQIIAPTHRMLTNIALDAFRRACPPGLIAAEHKTEKWLRLANGAEILLGSADNPGSLEGANLAWFWIDEARLVKREAWQVVVGRLREGRAKRLQGVLTTTPAMGWLSEEFDADLPDRLAIHASTTENAHNLAPGFVENLRRSYSARLAKALIDGQFAVIAGQVYEEFDETRHAVAWAYDPRLPLWLSWDFGVRASSVLFAQETGDFPYYLPDGRRLPPRSLVIFDELQIDEKPTQWQIPLVQQRLAGRKPWRIAVDPAGRGRDQATGYRSVELLEAAFGRCIRYETDFEQRYIPNRIARVQGALSPVEGDPTLYVDQSLVGGHKRGVVAALRGSTYPERAGRRTSDHPVEDDYEHARDTLEYLLVNAQQARGDGAWRQPLRVTYGV